MRFRVDIVESERGWKRRKRIVDKRAKEQEEIDNS